jgi:hypothetical protein
MSELWHRQALVLSMCGLVQNRIKICLDNPKKNIELAASLELRNLVFMIGEQLLPQWCR